MFLRGFYFSPCLQAHVLTPCTGLFQLWTVIHNCKLNKALSPQFSFCLVFHDSEQTSKKDQGCGLVYWAAIGNLERNFWAWYLLNFLSIASWSGNKHVEMEGHKDISVFDSKLSWWLLYIPNLLLWSFTILFSIFSSLSKWELG